MSWHIPSSQAQLWFRHCIPGRQFFLEFGRTLSNSYQYPGPPYTFENEKIKYVATAQRIKDIGILSEGRLQLLMSRPYNGGGVPEV
jgi:hypothetical protein